MKNVSDANWNTRGTQQRNRRKKKKPSGNFRTGKYHNEIRNPNNGLYSRIGIEIREPTQQRESGMKRKEQSLRNLTNIYVIRYQEEEQKEGGT